MQITCMMYEWEEKADGLTRQCSSKGAIVPYWPGTSCSRSASLVRPYPCWRVHWDPWL